MSQEPFIRPASNEDSAGIIALIAACYSEYPPNVVLLVDEEEPELRTPASSFDGFWVLEAEGKVCGCVAATKTGETVELKKMYLVKELRGRLWAQKLQVIVVNFAKEKGCSLELWTDTRFHRAHAFYSKCGWQKTGETRELHDFADTTEYRFILETE
ncbi:MAG TPA: GNAT family N-acetyltransferase [Planctomycetota bacterium]|jgi:putative acetyltransferase|nr:GNAT family N-acetyltransferase [Planctomycetota bacterium]HJM39411.1 GNAT family N-acetyltransferase [Planctomycetota bacterium]|tara:strand:+ start:99404 stop:99874 length:471 start_codon:yes stop_codon:yes gene_type:complete